VNRRTFLKAAGIGAGCVAAGGIGGGYVLLTRFGPDQFEALKTGFMETLVQTFGEGQGKALEDKIGQALTIALAEMPNVGTKEENRWADDMPAAALALAAHRVLVPAYATLEDLGAMFYRTVERQVSGLPSLLMQVTYDEGAAKETAKRLSVFFQQKRYPENWVTTFVEGNGRDFTFGIDVAECAICKYHRAHGAPELTRYLCLIDNITMGAQGRGLVRTTTLAEGCDKCDFRFKHGRANDVAPLRGGWPPKFVGS
jgi:hypothetical protein